MLKHLGNFCLSFALALFIIGFQELSSFAAQKQRATVIEVIDGDTLKVWYQGKKESLRLIGIDAPEQKSNPKAEHDAEKSHRALKTILKQGALSTEHLKGIVRPGEAIEIEFDVRLRDTYGRLLAYVFLKNGEMLNAKLLREGSAKLYTVPPDVKYVKDLKAAYKQRPQ